MTALVGAFALWRTAHILFGALVARRAVWIAQGMPLLAAGSVVMTPDVPSVLFWGLTGWALAELHVSQRAGWWLAVGFFAGLGLLSKYTNLFIGAGILLWLLVLRENWRWFRCWQLWAGGLIACACTIPVLLWNADHEWASFAKQFGRVVRNHDLSARYLLELVGGYIGLASPITAALAAIGMWTAVRAALRSQQAHAMLLAGAIPFAAYLVVHALHDRVQANWAAPLYPTFAVCAALALGCVFEPPRTKQLYRAACVAGLGLSGLLYVHVVHPIVLLPGARDPTAQMRGWPNLASEIERLADVNNARWIATANYGMTGQLAFAFGDRIPVVPLTEPVRYMHLPRVDPALLRSPGLFVERERRQDMAQIAQRFGTIVELGTVTRWQQNVPIERYRIYRIADPAD